MKKTETKQADANVATFTKEQLCNSVKYSRYKDVLSSQLKDDELYSFETLDKIIENFMKGKVN